MKPLLLVLIALCILINLPNAFGQQVDANFVFSKVLARLDTIDQLNYDNHISINYFSEGYQRQTELRVYIEFDAKEPLLGARFIQGNADYQTVFNGSQYFYIDKKKKTIQLTAKPSKTTFRSETFFVNSFYTLKHFLPQVISRKDWVKRTGDTLINGKPFRMGSFTLHNYMMGRFGVLEKLDMAKDITYTVIVDNSGLPYQVLQRDNLNPRDYLLITFSQITSTGAPAQAEWQYETYLDKYKPI
ncbi:hypothetical protein [Spirosoma sp. KUDC1026]|uniref:hypothetical protein n=1 Tax=Spirosoma sp. KUDC1026 TaxID=2745947 RepID=UPI00159B880C|nr:hypothetical protein [Spirosoma sp. KUDC1026]QKZ11326.1 hypothetical protein HU175_01205 [Spirosoma sp. KUDC1026]